MSRYNYKNSEEYEGDEDDYIDEIKHRTIMCSNQSLSLNNISIFDENEKMNNGVIMFVRPYRVKNKSTYDIYCFLYSELMDFLIKSNPVFIYRKEDGFADEKFPLYKLPNSGLWIEGNYFLLSRYSAYLVYDPSTVPIGSVFGVSSLHGAEEKIYRIHPISKTKFMKTKTIDITQLDTLILKKENDFAPGNFPNCKVEISKKENCFIEREVSKDEALLESIFYRNGSMYVSMFSSGKTHVLLKFLLSYTRENDYYKDRVITAVEGIRGANKMSKGNKEFSFKILEEFNQILFKVKRNGVVVMKERISSVINKEDIYRGLLNAIKYDDVSYVKKMAWQLDSDTISKVFNQATLKKRNEIIEIFLKNPNLSVPDLNQQFLLSLTIGNSELAELFLQDGRVDPSTEDNNAIITASSKGFADIVELLLTDKRIDPSVRHNKALRMARKNGHRTIVELLESDYRVNPHEEYESTEQRDLGSGEMEFDVDGSVRQGRQRMGELEEGEEFDGPNERRNHRGNAESPISVSDDSSNIENNSNGDNELRNAVVGNDLESVRTIMMEEGGNPSELLDAMLIATHQGFKDIIEYLMTKMDPSVGSNEILKEAIDTGRAEIVELLLTDPRVRTSINDDEMNERASALGFVNIAEMFY